MSKASKKRHPRATAARAIRRSLGEISPETSHPQTQSPLFSALPSEIRNMIFEFAICEIEDKSRSLSKYRGYGKVYPVPYYRPGHFYETTIETALLRACRLIYYETQAIPMKSATHHICPDALRVVDHPLFHLPKRQAEILYHLHHIVIQSWDLRLVSLAWKKITWTFRPTLFGFEQDLHRLLDGVSALREFTFPISCQEVNIEFEHQLVPVPQGEQEGPSKQKLVAACSEFSLTRSDGTGIPLDHVLEYEWSSAQRHIGDDPIKFNVIRLRWRSEVPPRKYAHLDHLDCLSCSSMKIISSLPVARAATLL
ncbi:hypothetical protein BCR34DRAFT_562273 [Clohesyomyces aquaticus]|uniref:Uncharacterized protein n=1 Tax=Clohesyomyces aquaticus TaxID=1231657 RepID=A0A1Y1ZSK7_9PLEO|nr:hypothetical protein BCR34DRAFT_562273 [Clohesyomyces aquaticus]